MSWGIPPPTSEKPYEAYKHVLTWGPKWEDVPEKWRSIVEKAIQ